MFSESNRFRFVKQAAVMALVPLFAASLGACSFDKLRPYRMDVRQGNFVDQAMIGQLKPGMSREQVRAIMGSSLLTDTFHQSRWDYVYRFTPGRGEPQQRAIALIFENEKLARVEGDVVPSTGEAQGEAAARPRVIEIDTSSQKP